MTMSAQQCRGARGLLGLSQAALCKLAGISPKPLSDFEMGHRKTHPRIVEKLRHALEAQGMRFIDKGMVSIEGGHGIRLSRYYQTK